MMMVMLVVWCGKGKGKNKRIAPRREHTSKALRYGTRS